MTTSAHPSKTTSDLGHSPDALAQRQADLLEPDRIVDRQEHYELNWAGKSEARREIQKTSSHTLRPSANNPAHAQHMLIEGENLEVLRVLQKSYYGKVKMIYIDPPYLFQSAEKAGHIQATEAQTAMLAELLLKHGLGALGVHAVSAPKQVAGVTVHRVLMPDDKAMWLCFDTYTDALKDEMVKAHPAQVVLLNSCFVGDKADEQLANLQLELAGLDIGLTVI